jgi:hypothetical protein
MLILRVPSANFAQEELQGCIFLASIDKLEEVKMLAVA